MTFDFYVFLLEGIGQNSSKLLGEPKMFSHSYSLPCGSFIENKRKFLFFTHLLKLSQYLNNIT